VVRAVVGIVEVRDVRTLVGREVASVEVFRTFVGSDVERAVVDSATVKFAVTILATDVAREVVEAFAAVEFATVTILATDVAREVVEALVVVELVVASVMTQDVAAPLPSTWQTTGWNAAGGHVSWVKDMR